jgi:SAM-dependent MidA family methyltransferase
MSVQQKIDLAIRASGSISIQDFVEISNFSKKDGFYNSEEKQKIGNKGHFITSPEISSLFGISLTNQFLSVFPDTKKVHLIEFGPGNGYLTLDILNYLKSKKIDVQKISILEKSNFFIKEIRRKIPSAEVFDDLQNIKINPNITTFFYSNEFFDAFGSKQYIHQNKKFNEIKITKINNDYKLVYEENLISSHLKNKYSNYEFEDKDILEHSVLIDNLLIQLNEKLKKNFFFSTTDYGYLKLPRKSTLRLISNHKKVNLFEDFENIDYSFGVNFEYLKDNFKAFKPKIISQKELFKNYLNENIYSEDKDKFDKIIDMLGGSHFENMGDQFLNISFYAV